jgi:hypothetical protein
MELETWVFSLIMHVLPVLPLQQPPHEVSFTVWTLYTLVFSRVFYVVPGAICWVCRNNGAERCPLTLYKPLNFPPYLDVHCFASVALSLGNMITFKLVLDQIFYSPSTLKIWNTTSFYTCIDKKYIFIFYLMKPFLISPIFEIPS